MDSNPICHPSPANKMKCSFPYYIQLLMLATLVNDSNPIHHPAPAKKMKYFFYGLHSTSDDWLGWVMDSNPICHPSPANKMNASFWIMFTSDDQPGWSMDSNPICHPLQPNKWNAHFCIMFNFWWSAGLVEGLEPHPPPLSSQKNEMLIFVLHSTSDVGQTGQWTWTSSTTPLQPKEWNAHFWVTFNFWWLVGLFDELKPHLPPLSSQKNEMLVFRLLHFWWSAWLIDELESHLKPLPTKEMKCSIFDYVQLLMISWAGQWTQTPFTTCLLPKKWNGHIWLCSTSDDWLGWSMDSNPIHHPSPPKKMNCSFWITFNFWWLAGLVNGLKLPLPALSSQKHEMLLFGFHSTSDDWLGWSMDSNPILHPSPAKKVKCSFLYYIQHLMLARLVNGLEPHPPLLSSQNMKCSFLGYILLLMISWAVRWTQTPSATPLQPIKWNAHFWITFNFWWSAGLVNGLEPHPPPVSRQKN